MIKNQLQEIRNLPIYISDGNYSSKYPKGEEFINEGVPFIRANNIKNNTIIDSDMYFISNEKHAILKKGHLKTNDVLLSTRGNIGLIGLVPQKYDNANINAQLVLLRPTDQSIDNRYLMWVLKSSDVKRQFQKLQTGTALKQLPINKLLDLKILIPSIEEQRDIVKAIEHIDALHQKRKETIWLLDEYIKSVFLEMFDDQTVNSKRWKIKTLQDLTTKLGDGLHGTPIYDESGDYFFINGNNLEDGKIIIKNSTKRVSQEEFEKYKKPLNENSILVSINGTLGRVAFYHGEKIILGKSACYFNVKQEEIDPLYLYFILKSDYFVKYASGNSTGSTIQNVSLKTMRNFPLMLPPLHLQKQFAEIVQRVESVKQKMFLQSQELDIQFQSLMQKSFLHIG